MNQARQNFLLRMESSLFESLKAQALEEGVSMNEFCKARLSRDYSSVSVFEQLKKHIKKSMGLDLIGAVLFGSTARGTATSTSDKDLLLVMDEGDVVSRELYVTWDYLIEQKKLATLAQFTPHFSSLPREPLRTEGIWLETTLDGIILWEEDFRVSRFFGLIKRAIADGKLIRKVSHGHPYWMTATDA